MQPTVKIKIRYTVLGLLIGIGFVLLTGFRLPGPSQGGTAGYQFFKEKDSTGVWIFEPDTGTSKFFDREKGEVVINSYQMDTITVKAGAMPKQKQSP